MARKLEYGDSVKILDGMKEFIGATGAVRDIERDGQTTLYRIRLDIPVNVPGVGLVKDDLWAREYLRKLRD